MHYVKFIEVGMCRLNGLLSLSLCLCVCVFQDFQKAKTPNKRFLDRVSIRAGLFTKPCHNLV